MALQKKDETEDRARETIEAAGLPMKSGGKLEPLLIRLGKYDRKRLENHFSSKGLKMAQGIRMVLKEYLEQQGIH